MCDRIEKMALYLYFSGTALYGGGDVDDDDDDTMCTWWYNVRGASKIHGHNYLKYAA